jgi:Uma2 family endonuclease
MATAATHPEPDPTHYPIEDDVGEGLLQRLISELFRPLLARFLAERGERALVGADQLIYWVQHEPTTCVSPDVYVLPGVDPSLVPACWKTWETGVVPSFALEIVSRHGRGKDYERAPLRYAELGVGELVIFDPDFAGSAERIRWQVYRPMPGRGFVRVLRTNADRIRSSALRCWLVSSGEGASTRVRLATGEHGEDLVPTDAELAASRSAERARREAAEARREAAEAEAARLRSELERLRRG